MSAYEPVRTQTDVVGDLDGRAVMAGPVPLSSCPRCAAIVRVQDEDAHDEWHAAVTQ